MARQFNNLKKRGNRWFVRLMIPRDLRHLYRRREFMRALGTDCPVEARLRGFNFLAAVTREFQDVRYTGALPKILAANSVLAAPPAPPVPAASIPPLHGALLVTSLPRAIRNGVPTIMEAFDLYAEDNPRKVSEDTLKQNRYVVRLFAEFLGTSQLVTAINKNAVREWRKALAEWPIKANEVKELKGLTFPQALIVARASASAKRRLIGI